MWHEHLNFRALTLVVGLGAVISAVMSLAFLGLNYLAMSTDRHAIADAVRTAFANPAALTTWSLQPHNDCLLPAMALSRGEPAIQYAVSPKRIYGVRGSGDICLALRQIVFDGAVDEAAYVQVFYHQYWLGQRALLSFMLPWMSVSTVHRVFGYASYLILIAGLLRMGALRKMPPPFRCSFGAGPDARFAALAIGVVVVTFMFFTALPFNAGNLTTGPSNIIAFLFLVSSLWINYLSMPSAKRIVIIAGFGAVMAYLALLQGSSLVGLLLVTFVASIQPIGKEGWWPRLGLIIEFATAYCVAFAGCMAIKILFVSLAFDINMFNSFFDLLRFRMTGDARTTVSPEIAYWFVQRDVTLQEVATVLYQRLDTVGAGSHGLGLFLAAGALVVNAAALGCILIQVRQLRDPGRWAGLIATSLCVGLWYLVFQEHTYSHSGLMVYLLFWPIGMAGVFVLAVISSRRSAGELHTERHAAQRGSRSRQETASGSVVIP